MCKEAKTEVPSEEQTQKMASDEVPLSQQENDSDEVEHLPEIDKKGQTYESAPDEEQATPREEPLTEVRANLSELRTLFESKIARDKSQSEIFDALYLEMKDYKENFLLEALHKPIIKDLIMLYDSFALLESQLDKNLVSDELKQLRTNLENVRYQLLEVLYRIDVTPYEQRLEQLDRKLHKTLETIPTDNPEQDGKVAQVHKLGFYWRDKVFRPEEVTIYRYTPPTSD